MPGEMAAALRSGHRDHDGYRRHLWNCRSGHRGIHNLGE